MEATVQGTIDSVRTRVRKFIGGASDSAMLRLQWGYLLVSLATLWWMMGYVEQRLGDKWGKSAGLSVIYLAGCALLLSALVPRQVVQAVWLYTSWRIKLSLIANYLALLLLFQVLSDIWWMRATNMGGLLLATLGGVFLFYWLVAPIKERIESEYKDSDNKALDPLAPQGRKGRHD